MTPAELRRDAYLYEQLAASFIRRATELTGALEASRLLHKASTALADASKALAAKADELEETR